MKKTLVILLCSCIWIPALFAQDSLLVTKLAELYTHANYESISDVRNWGCCIADENKFLYLQRNLDYRPILLPDTVKGFISNYFAVDDSGVVSTFSHVVNERWQSTGKCYHVSPGNDIVYTATSMGFESIQNDPYRNYIYEIPGGGRWIVHHGDSGFLVANNGYVYSLDNINTSVISVMDSLRIGVEAEDFYFEFPYLMLALGEQGWTIIDLSDENNLSQITPPYSDIHAYDFEYYRDNFWLGSEDDGIYHFNITDLEDIQFLENVPIYVNEFGLDTRGQISKIYNNNSLDIMNWFTPDSVFLLDRFGQSRVMDFFVFPAEWVTYQGIVLDQLSGTRRIGMDIPDQPIDFPGFPETFGNIIDGVDSLFAVQSVNNSLLIFRYQEYVQDDLKIVWTIPLDEELSDLDIYNDHLFTLSENTGLSIYQLSISDPLELVYENDQIVGEGMDIGSNYLCVVDPDYGLKTYSLNLTELAVNEGGTVNLNTSPLDLILYQRFAFVSCGEDGFKIVDCYNNGNPQLASEVDTDGYTYDIAFGGSYFYIADGENGALVYDIHNPYEPELVGYYDTPGNARGIDAWHENFGVADESGLHYLRYAFATDTPDKMPALPSEFRIESVYPNPFNPDCHVKISVPTSGIMNLKVFNVLGEEVSSLSKSRVKEGYFEYQFFGKNFSSGTYILQVELEGYGIQTTKMVLLK